MWEKFLSVYCASYKIEIGLKLGVFLVGSSFSAARFLVPTRSFRNGSVFACSTSRSSAADFVKWVETELFRSCPKRQRIVARHHLDWFLVTSPDVAMEHVRTNFQIFFLVVIYSTWSFILHVSCHYSSLLTASSWVIDWTLVLDKVDI